MSRYNGTFRYNALTSERERDPETGFVTSGSVSDWIEGCECQIDKSIPAKEYRGSDGQVFTYTYDLFIYRQFDHEITIGSEIEITLEDGSTDTFTVQGVDNSNRKYLELWG